MLILVWNNGIIECKAKLEILLLEWFFISKVKLAKILFLKDKLEKK